MNMKRNKRKGFTILELVLVLALISIILLIAVPNYLKIKKDANLKVDEIEEKQQNFKYKDLQGNLITANREDTINKILEHKLKTDIQGNGTTAGGSNNNGTTAGGSNNNGTTAGGGSDNIKPPAPPQPPAPPPPPPNPPTQPPTTEDNKEPSFNPCTNDYYFVKYPHLMDQHNKELHFSRYDGNFNYDCEYHSREFMPCNLIEICCYYYIGDL